MSVENRSSRLVFIKLEESGTVVSLEPGGTFEGRQDGLAIPALSPGKVFKTPDHVDAVVLEDGTVETRVQGFGVPVPTMLGGWLTTAPDAGWDPLFAAAGSSAERAPSPAQPSTLDPASSPARSSLEERRDRSEGTAEHRGSRSEHRPERREEKPDKPREKPSRPEGPEIRGGGRGLF